MNANETAINQSSIEVNESNYQLQNISKDSLLNFYNSLIC